MAMYFKRKKVAPIVLSSKPDTLQSRIDETKSCRYLFYQYSGTNPDCVKNLDTTGVTNMQYMFQQCEKLTSLDVSNFNTSNVTYMSYMFSECSSLTSLDLSNFDTSNVKDMSYMFYNCTALQHLDISNFDFTKVTSYSSMFSGVPADCEILVKDETAKTWITSKFTNLTNVKVKGAV